MFIDFEANASLFMDLPAFLQERLAQETSAEPFSVLPFRFAEVGKVILDMLVPVPTTRRYLMGWLIVHQMISKIQIKSAAYSRTCVRLGKPKAGRVFENWITFRSVYVVIP